jgi:hypothetical protein
VPQKALPRTLGGCGCLSVAMGRLIHTCPAERDSHPEQAARRQKSVFAMTVNRVGATQIRRT